MLSICEKFAIEYDVLFNATKSKFITYAAISNNETINITFMGGTIENVRYDKHLGNVIGHNVQDVIIEECIRDFYVRVNILINMFSHTNCDIKYKLFKSYCMPLYGCQLWDFSKLHTEQFYTAWRKFIRRLMGLPYNTHCKYLNIIRDDIPVHTRTMPIVVATL